MKIELTKASAPPKHGVRPQIHIFTDHLLIAFENWLMEGTMDFTLPFIEQSILLMWMTTYRDRDIKDLN